MQQIKTEAQWNGAMCVCSMLAELSEEQLLIPAVCHTCEMTHTLRGGYFHLQNTLTVFPHTHHHHFKQQPAHNGGRPVFSSPLKLYIFSRQACYGKKIKVPDSAGITPSKYP